jgi:hypothetical protein
VYGVSGKIADADTPDFGSLGDPRLGGAGLGVVGVAVDCPAILGESGIKGADTDGLRSLKDLVGQQVGVVGVTVAGPGVFGFSLGGDPKTEIDIGGIFSDRFGVDGTNVVDAGVEGLGLRGPGVHGVSRFERGGVFKSTPANGAVAQLRLIPIPSEFAVVGPGGLQPPTARGEAGDLLALNYVDQRIQRMRASLWFCTEGFSTSGSAVWVRVV